MFEKIPEWLIEIIRYYEGRIGIIEDYREAYKQAEESDIIRLENAVGGLG